MNCEPKSLGKKLSPILGGGFFRPLTRPTAPIYIDCAERVAEAADEGGQIPHADARLLIREVLMNHPDVQLEEDEGGQLRDQNQRAAQFFNKLIEAHWLQTRRISLDEHYVLITPQLRRLMRLLRELGEDRPAELKDFAATLRSLCRDLLHEDALDPNRLSAEEMRQTMKDLLDRVNHAEEQMHAVESLILEHEAAQRVSGSAQETLQRLLVDFHAGEHMVCYDVLQKAGLLPRLTQARSVVQEALYDPFTKQRLSEGLAKHFEMEPSDAYAEAERWLAKLERQLASIPIKQGIIDGRMSDFAKLSAARYRYQTEMRGRRPEQVKAYVDNAARLHAGKSFADLADEPGMTLLCPVVEVYYGADSLSRARRQRAPVELTLQKPPDQGSAEDAKDEIRRRNLNILNPQRAARFIEKHLPDKGARISTESLRVESEEDLLDLLGVLAFDRGSADGSRRTVRWRIQSARADFGLEPERIPRDREGDRLVERFIVERIT